MLIKKGVKAFLKRGIISALAGTFLAGIILPATLYGLRLGLFLVFFVICLPFTTIAVLGIGWVIWWIQEISEHNLHLLIRIIMGTLIGISLGVIFGVLRYNWVRRTGTPYFYMKYFGIYGLILGTMTGAIIGSRFHTEEIATEPNL